MLFLDQEIVHHHDPGDRPQQAGIAEQPVGIDRFQAEIGNDQAELFQQFMGHQRKSDQPGEDYRFGPVDRLGCDVLEIVGGRHDVGRGVGRQRGDDDQRHGQRHPDRTLDMADQGHRVGHRHPHQLHRGGGHHHAQGGKQEHGQRQADDLPDNLVLLAFRVAAEVGDVQRQRGPEPDHRGQPGREVTGHARAFGALGRDRQ
ncbi:hypothetical protein D3C78_755440 [compost metagenome]